MHYMRDVLGVRDSTPLRVLMAELGRYPLEFHMAKLVARYWERLVAMPATRLPRRALAANLLLAEQQRAREVPEAAQCWAGQVNTFLQRFPAAQRTGSDGGIIRVNPAMVERQLREQFIEDFNGGGVGNKTVDYRTEIRGGSISIASYQLPHYLQQLSGRFHITSLAQLRTGSHWLALETGRWKRDPNGRRIPREQRICPHCTAGEVEHERHMIFACSHYDDLRTQHQDLFMELGGNLKDFLEQDPSSVATFVAACRRRAALTTQDEDLRAQFSNSQVEESPIQGGTP
jgi:hypothetical protein